MWIGRRRTRRKSRRRRATIREAQEKHQCGELQKKQKIDMKVHNPFECLECEGNDSAIYDCPGDAQRLPPLMMAGKPKQSIGHQCQTIDCSGCARTRKNTDEERWELALQSLVKSSNKAIRREKKERKGPSFSIASKNIQTPPPGINEKNNQIERGRNARWPEKPEGCEEIGKVRCEINILEDEGEQREKVSMLANVESQGTRWIKIEAAVDSGAVDPVISHEIVPHLTVRPTPESERGEEWTAAGGHKIKKLGEVIVPWMTSTHRWKWSRMKVGAVKRTLISVSRLNECGYEALLNQRNPRLINTWTGETIPLERNRGMFIVDMWIKVPGESAKSTEGFARRP